MAVSSERIEPPRPMNTPSRDCTVWPCVDWAGGAAAATVGTRASSASKVSFFMAFSSRFCAADFAPPGRARQAGALGGFDQSALFQQRPELRLAAAELDEDVHRGLAATLREHGVAEAPADLGIEQALLLECREGIRREDF